MIKSLMVHGIYRMEDTNGTITVEGEKLNLKDIPMVRYRLERYDQEAVDYIIKQMGNFRISTHIVEAQLDKVNKNIEHEQLKRLKDRCAVFLHMDVNDTWINDDVFYEEYMADADDFMAAISVDQICLNDKTSGMTVEQGKKLIKDTAEYFCIEEENVAICGSPLSCLGYACLTALKARRIMSEYSDADDVPLPTAKHENTECGCVHFANVREDILRKIRVAKKTERKADQGGKQAEKKARGISFGATRL